MKAKGAEVLSFPADITKSDDLKNLVSQAAEKFLGGSISLSTNTGTGRLSDPMELPEEEFGTTWI